MSKLEKRRDKEYKRALKKRLGSKLRAKSGETGQWIWLGDNGAPPMDEKTIKKLMRSYRRHKVKKRDPLDPASLPVLMKSDAPAEPTKFLNIGDTVKKAEKRKAKRGKGKGKK